MVSLFGCTDVLQQDDSVETSKSTNYRSICFVTDDRERCFYAEIANEPKTIQKGLMNREYLAKDHAMLFIFPDSQERTFWMMNTTIPLDIIFIDENFKVITIHKNCTFCSTEPCARYSSSGPAQYVVELNAGSVTKYGLAINDNIRI